MKSQLGSLSLVWFFGLISVLTISVAVERGTADSDAPTVVVVDGDTLEVNGVTVKLYGVDAPEIGQFCMNGTTRYRCGYEAALKLTKLLGNGPVECRPTPVDASDQGQICSVGLVDLAEAMLRQGFAVAQPSALAGYRRAESEAKRSKLGIWRGDFVPPAEWRSGQRLQTKGNEPKQICDIKGIVSDAGERVYLIPNDPEYNGINIDPSRGEMSFCSDDQAELAGWRRWPKSAAQQRAGVGNKQSD